MSLGKVSDSSNKKKHLNVVSSQAMLHKLWTASMGFEITRDP